MKEHGFDWGIIEKQSSIGVMFRPMMHLQIRSKFGDWKKFIGEIDSGSPVTLFNESDCEFLGYDLKNGKPFDIYGIFGDKRKAYLHDLNIKIGKDIVKSKIAFTEGPHHKQLIGRIDIFDNFEINLRGKILKSYFLKEP